MISVARTMSHCRHPSRVQRLSRKLASCSHRKPQRQPRTRWIREQQGRMPLPARWPFSRGVMESPPTNSQSQNKFPPTTTRLTLLTSASQPEPSPTETQAPQSAIQTSPIESRTSSLPPRRQSTNQAAGSDHRGPAKVQLLPYPTQSSITLSTKARIAEGMRSGPVSLSQSKYKGMRMRKNANPPEEPGSPVVPSVTGIQPAPDLSRRASLPHFSNEHVNQAPIRKASLQQYSPPPPPPEQPSHDTDLDRMDVDQHEFVHSPYYYRFYIFASTRPPPSPPPPEKLTAADDLLHTIVPQR